METLIIGQHEIHDLLPMEQCIEVVREALFDLARGEGIQPLRPVMWLPGKVGALGMMPGYLSSIDTVGIKTVTVFPGNADTEFDSHQGTVMLFDAANGSLKAVIDATEITAIRTAAASAVATDLLAREDSSVLAILGSGVQARTHIRSMSVVREIDQVRVWSRNHDNATRLVDSSVAPGCRIRSVDSVAEAVAGADIVCTTTAAREPILLGTMLEPGMHINAVGSSVPFARELDAPAMAMSLLFVDRRESTLKESGDFLLAKEEGAIDDHSIAAEIGELIVGSHPGRIGNDEITIFESLGLGVEDVAAADLVYRNALASGAGVGIEIGGARHA